MHWVGGIAVLVMSLAGVAHAQSVPSQSAAMRRRIAMDKIKARFLRNEEVSILEGLRELEAGIEVRQKLTGELEDQIDALDIRMSSLEQKLKEHNERLSDIRERFGQRAAAMLRLKRTRLVRLLRYAKSPNDLRRMKDRLARIRKYDLELMNSILEAGAEDRQLKTSLNAQQQELFEAKSTLDSESEAEIQMREERAALLEAIRKERSVTDRLTRELERAARRLDAAGGRLLGSGPPPEPVAGGFGAQRGRLAWPVAGRLDVAFGRKVDPLSSVVLVQKGIDLKAKQSEPVRAVFGGQVVFAKRQPGYGRLVVLDHDSYYTIYGHLESFAVSKGQTVNRLQIIGYVGDSDSHKGPYLYFEIRKGREPVDPMSWLSR